RVAHRFLEDGLPGLADRRAGKGEHKDNPRDVAGVLRVVATSPPDHRYARPTLTPELLIVVLAERTGLALGVRANGRLLKRHRVRLGRPRPIVDCPWDEARKGRRLRRLRRLAKDLGPDEVLVYLDEVDIHLNPKIGLDWMLRGQQKEARTPGQNQKR